MKDVTCEVCLETNLIISGGFPRQCAGHTPFRLSPAATIFSRTVDRLIHQNRNVDSTLFDLARFLTVFDADHPCPRSVIEVRFCPRDVPSFNERRIKRWIEQLRRDWLLPVGSFKNLSGGYYLITGAEDFIRWQKENMAGALTALKTNYRVFKQNFPEMAGQQAFDFERHVQDDLRAVLQEA